MTRWILVVDLDKREGKVRKIYFYNGALDQACDDLELAPEEPRP